MCIVLAYCYSTQCHACLCSSPPPAGYITTILEDARVYSEHAQKKELDVADVRLAIQNRMDHSFKFSVKVTGLLRGGRGRAKFVQVFSPHRN